MTQNSAELEAEKILMEAWDDAQAEFCPQGKKCGVHFRVDEETVDEDEKYMRLITYVDDYVIVTEDNHVLEDVDVRIAIAMGVKSMPDRWETSVYHVGKGTIGDLSDKPAQVRRDALRYAITHNEWTNVKEEHFDVVLDVEDGEIDLSEPFEE